MANGDSETRSGTHWSKSNVTLWQLLASLGGVAALSVGYVYTQGYQRAELEQKFEQMRLDQARQDVSIAELNRRREIDEARLNKVELEDALMEQRFNQMTQEHSNIYSAIEGLRGSVLLKGKK